MKNAAFLFTLLVASSSVFALTPKSGSLYLALDKGESMIACKERSNLRAAVGDLNRDLAWGPMRGANSSNSETIEANNQGFFADKPFLVSAPTIIKTESGYVACVTITKE